MEELSANEEKAENIEALQATLAEKEEMIGKLREEEEKRKNKFVIVKNKFDDDLKQANDRISQLEQQVIFCLMMKSFIQ